jgi:opacity protein-like surface antigen
MNARKLFKAMFFFLILSVISLPLFSQDEQDYENFLELSLSIGSATDADLIFNDNSQLYIDSSYSMSANLAYFFNRFAAVEVSFINRFDKAYYVPDKSLSIDPSNYIRENFFNYHLNMGLLFNFGDLVHVPFVTAGVGLTSLEFSDAFSVADCNNRFTFFGAAGYKYYLSENFAARVQITMEFFDYENLNHQNEFFTNLLISAGLTFRIK